MKNKTAELKAKFNTNVVCPEDASSPAFKKAAWDDQQDAADSIGLMHCYCDHRLKKKKSLDATKVKFTEFLKKKCNKEGKECKDQPDPELYCEEWFQNYAT